MWPRISDWIHSVSNGWVAFSALVIFLLFTALVLPGQTSTVDADYRDPGSPDLSFYYTAKDLYQMADAYGEEGREAYIRARFSFDLIWPLVYALFLCTAISWIFHKAFVLASVWQRANIAPVLAAVFDYLENISTSLVMARYPSPTAVLDRTASVFTMVKWVLVGVSFALLLVGVVVGVIAWIKARGMQKEV